MAAYEGARSFCICGHSGDVDLQSKPRGDESLHSGPAGHGACLSHGCSCIKFTWAEYRVDYMKSDAFAERSKKMGVK